MSEPTKEATAYALDEAKQAQKRHGLTDLATAMYMEAAELGYMQGIAAAQPEPAAREMPEAVRDAVDTLRSGVPSYPTWRQYADTLESWWRNLAQPVAVGMTPELEFILDECTALSVDKQRFLSGLAARRLAECAAAVRQQAAQGRKVEFPKGRELVSMVRSLTPYLSQLGCTDLARSFNDYADASATELDAAEGKERE